VIAIGEDGWTDTAESLEVERVTSAYGVHKPWWRGVSFFHRDGNRYEVLSATPMRSLLPLSKLLARTIYNPRFTVRYDYHSVGRYELADLTRALENAIDKDDDVLTQFREAGELKRRLAKVRSFDDVVNLLQFSATED